MKLLVLIIIFLVSIVFCIYSVVGLVLDSNLVYFATFGIPLFLYAVILTFDYWNELQIELVGSYMKTHKFKSFLMNQYVFCCYMAEEQKFLIKEKTDGVYSGKCFLSSENPESTTLFWALIQKKFTQNTSLDMILNLKLGSRKIFFSRHKDKGIQLDENTLCNEYCKMHFRRNVPEICVTELWHDKNENSRSFIIKGRIAPLREIFATFRRLTFEDYDILLAKYKQYDVKIETSDDKLIDVNNATLEELKKLPIINVVTAKKLIKKREEIGGFNSVQDVCIFLRLTFSQEDRMNKLICVKPMKISPARIKTEERNVDL